MKDSDRGRVDRLDRLSALRSLRVRAIVVRLTAIDTSLDNFFTYELSEVPDRCMAVDAELKPLSVSFS